MTLMLPLAIAAALAAVAFAVWANEANHRRRHPPTGAPRIDRGTEMWAQEVRRRLPEAFDALQVTKAGYMQQGKRPRPRFVGAGKPAPVGVGWQWTLALPGSSLATDWDATRLVAAINDASELGTIAEMRAPVPGKAQLTIWRRDPLDMVQPVPWRPGERPSCCRPGQVCMGPQRNGKHVHFDVYGDVGAYASRFIGRRGSGKSEAMRLWLAQVLAWDHVDPVIVDLVRQGVDYGVFEPLLATEIITDPAVAVAAIDAIRAEASARAKKFKAEGRKKQTAPTADMPLIPLVIDEVQSVTDIKAAALGLRKVLQETRPWMITPCLATQYDVSENLDRTTALQITNTWCGRMGDANASYNTFSRTDYPGRAPHELSGPGASVCDTDHPELYEIRGWWAADQWHADHVGLLASRRERVG